ncbi:hypothetical protein GCM10025786_09170 [Nocardioides caeni]
MVDVDPVQQGVEVHVVEDHLGRDRIDDPSRDGSRDTTEETGLWRSHADSVPRGTGRPT